VSADPFATAQVGRTSLRVARFGLGTAPLGGWPDAVPFEQGVATVRRAWDKGVRFFDTAPFYGFGYSERMLGEVLSSVPRDEFVISTKVGRVLEPEPPSAELRDFFKGADPNTPVFDFSHDGAMRSLESSLERLKLDRVDIVLIHDPDDHHQEALEGAFKTLDSLRADGTVGAVGVGMNWSEPLARFAREADFDIFLLAGRYTLLEQDSMDELLPAVAETGMSIIAGGVYNSGVMADPDSQARDHYAVAPSGVVDRARAIRDACAEFGVPLRAAASQFPLAHPQIATVAIGSRTPAELDDNLEMLTLDVPDDLWTTLRERGLIRADAPTPPRRSAAEA
jgi:D-threo-aldose 1-dehydrogenase